MKIDVADSPRLEVGIAEFDRVLGGGFVPGSAVLVGGEPGIGKSTLLLQVTAALAQSGATALVATAEESAEQVALRARRLGTTDPNLYTVAERDVDAIIASAAMLRPDVLVVDSVQTVSAADVAGAPGGVAQVREAAARLIQAAKDERMSVVLVGHVTKDGNIAGPKLLEHAVDVVLYLEGESDIGLRLLRCFKNRFGSAHQVGVFEMGEEGMTQVTEPSRAFVGDWRGRVPGTIIFPAMEGKRPLLLEVQALVGSDASHQPRRSARGVDQSRVHQLLAVLDRHAGLPYRTSDVYVSVVGGVKVREPAIDLPVALALASSLLEQPLGAVAAWGEVGLTGEVRPVAHARRRSEEAARLGIDTVFAAGDGRRDRIGTLLAAAGLLPAA